MIEIVFLITTIASNILVGFALFVIYRILRDTRKSDLELVNKFADMMLAGDFKSYESFKDYGNRQVALHTANKPIQRDADRLAVDRLTDNLDK
jgi:hypothetical protein